MSIANNFDYGVLSRIHAPLEQPSELEVILMSAVSAVPQGDENFELGGQRGAKRHAPSHGYFKPRRLKEKRALSQLPAGAFPCSN